jgi:multidrug efflux pump subunit AcrA (membrane-fusion protein)
MKLPTLFALLLAACGSHETPPSAAKTPSADGWIVKLPKLIVKSHTAKLIDCTAVITSRNSHVVTAESDGTVMALQAHTDAFVRQGDPIAQLDVSALRAEQAEAEGQMINAQGQAARAGAQYAAAARKVKIEGRLARVGASSIETVNAAKSEASAAGGEGAGAAGTIQQAKVKIAETKRLIEAANIKAPMDGTVAVIKVHIGDMARKGSPIARVFDPNDPIVKFAMPRTSHESVHIGDVVQMNVGEHSINVTVSSITDDHDPSIDFFTVVAELDKATISSRPADIKVGASGHVRIADKGAVR